MAIFFAAAIACQSEATSAPNSDEKRIKVRRPTPFPKLPAFFLTKLTALLAIDLMVSKMNSAVQNESFQVSNVRGAGAILSVHCMLAVNSMCTCGGSRPSVS